jgi:hypothetical protein
MEEAIAAVHAHFNNRARRYNLREHSRRHDVAVETMHAALMRLAALQPIDGRSTGPGVAWAITDETALLALRVYKAHVAETVAARKRAKP